MKKPAVSLAVVIAWIRGKMEEDGESWRTEEGSHLLVQ